MPYYKPGSQQVLAWHVCVVKREFKAMKLVTKMLRAEEYERVQILMMAALRQQLNNFNVYRLA